MWQCYFFLHLLILISKFSVDSFILTIVPGVGLSLSHLDNVISIECVSAFPSSPPPLIIYWSELILKVEKSQPKLKAKPGQVHSSSAQLKAKIRLGWGFLYNYTWHCTGTAPAPQKVSTASGKIQPTRIWLKLSG